jgi:redox-sensing transcriptional repressor
MVFLPPFRAELACFSYNYIAAEDARLDRRMNKKSATPEVENASTVKPSRASVGRLSLYLRRLEMLHREGINKVSSRLLGEALGVTDAQVRKDLAYLGNLGHPGIGYAAPELIAAIRRILGIDRDWPTVLVGVGNLARALLRYQGFIERGFRFVALFDADPAKIGQTIEGLTVHALEAMPTVLATTKAELGVLTVPSQAAQSVAEALVAAGIRGVLNFTPQVLRLPADISVVSVDLTVQLEQLAFLVQLGGEEPSR